MSTEATRFDSKQPHQASEDAVFKPYWDRKCKPGTGCISKVSKNTWQGKYTPVNPDGSRQRYCVYARTREECERKLQEMIKQTGGIFHQSAQIS